jgi:hypothetical protein
MIRFASHFKSRARISYSWKWGCKPGGILTGRGADGLAMGRDAFYKADNCKEIVSLIRWDAGSLPEGYSWGLIHTDGFIILHIHLSKERS